MNFVSGNRRFALIVSIFVREERILRILFLCIAMASFRWCKEVVTIYIPDRYDTLTHLNHLLVCIQTSVNRLFFRSNWYLRCYLFHFNHREIP